MATKAKASNEGAEITVQELKIGTVQLFILGTSPLIFNRLPEKARRELLMPAPKKTAMDKASNLKHDPLQEYRSSPYIIRDPEAPTLLGLPDGTFKGAMCTASLRLPGTKKTEIGQLTSLVNQRTIPVWGVPKILSTIVRSADMNRTPDVRTRAILPEWASVITVSYVKPNLRDQAIVNLVSAAGVVAGVGDWRQEKGKGSYGSFRICAQDDPDFLRIIQSGDRAAQEAGLKDPESYDDETDELLAWFDVEVRRRGFFDANDKKKVAA